MKRVAFLVMASQQKFQGLAVLIALIMMASSGLGSRVSGQIVQGLVVELGTDRPIQLATVSLIATTGDTVASGLTDENGFYSVMPEDEGTFMLVVRALGHRGKREGPFEIEAQGVRIVRINLDKAPVNIEGITVGVDPADFRLHSTGFYERLENEKGYFLTPEDIFRSTAFFTQELFRGGLDGRTYVNPTEVPWNAAVRFRALMGGTCTPRVYVDGVFQYLDERYSLDAAIPMDQIAAVEVYRGPFEQPPPRYHTTGGCGAILFWTRDGQ